LGNPQNLPITQSDKPVPLDYLISLRQKKLTYQQIADIVGRSKPAVFLRLKQADIEINWVREFRDNRAFLLSCLQRRILDSITPADLLKANLRDKIISMGVLYDKERLELNLATSINSSYSDMIEAKKQVQKQIEDLDKRYKTK
jgi:hypothetical protein